MMKKLPLLSITLLGIVILSTSPIKAQTFSEIIKAVASDRISADQFGISVSISDDYAIIGAYLEDDDAAGVNYLNSAGSAYIFKNDGADNWTQIQKIVAADREEADRFGWSVAISGDYAIVGAADEDHDAAGANYILAAGSAYIFKNDGADNWTQIQKIVASDRESVDKFGFSVAISGDYAIVGATYENHDAAGTISFSDAGSAYIFKNDGADNWTQIQKIVASDRASVDNFGWSLDISGDYAIVGALKEDHNAAGSDYRSGAGSAYIFKNDGADNWTQIQKIVASDRASDDYFGRSVAISGDYAIVGANQEDEDAAGTNNLSAAGSAYIFKNDGADNWTQIQKIVASDRASDDYFGWSVAISGDYAIVGAFQEDEDAAGTNNFSSAGSAYIFKNDGADNWAQIEKIVASDRASEDLFGYCVAISGDYAIVGARYEDHNSVGLLPNSKAGSAYIFKRTTVVPVELTYFTGQAIAEGTLLSWQTASEQNNKGFYIERSADGREWETIDFVEGNGTTYEMQHYTYTDETPLTGVNYYRLKQVDFDDEFEYSKVVEIMMTSLEKETIKIFPNPVQDKLNIINGKGVAIIYNMLGQPLRIFQIPNATFQIPLSDLSKGVYLFQFQKIDGSVVSKQVIKVK